jgi:hypothetical protein
MARMAWECGFPALFVVGTALAIYTANPSKLMESHHEIRKPAAA